MRGQPTVYRVDAALVLRGMLEPESEARTVLDLAACNIIEAHASSADWNLVMWALQQTLTKRGQQPMSGEELQDLRSALPVSFRG